MSLLESGESDGSVSLSRLMDGESSRPQSPGVQIPEMIDLPADKQRPAAG